MTRIRIKLQGEVMNRFFVVAKVNRQWQIVHRLSGVRTHYSAMKKSDLMAFARAATKLYRATLLENNPAILVSALRGLGSAQWASEWWATRRKRA